MALRASRRVAHKLSRFTSSIRWSPRPMSTTTRDDDPRREALSYLKNLPLVHGDTRITKENLVEYTCFFTAYIRAMETARPDSIVKDPFAKALAGQVGEQVVLASKSKRLDVSINMMAIRTRSIDEAIDQRDPSIQQVVILAAGLDSRAYRLQSLAGATVFEVDRFRGLKDYKTQVLADQLNAHPIVGTTVQMVEADVMQSAWTHALVAAGFDSSKPTFWVLEGLLYYLTKDSIIQLLQTMDTLSAPKSEFWTDLCGNEVFEDRSWGFSSLFAFGEDQDQAQGHGQVQVQQAFAHGVLSCIQWDLRQQADLSRPSVHFGRLWKPIELETKDKQTKPLRWVFMTGKKPCHQLP